MGKPYAAELAHLGETYDWALQVSIEKLSAAIAKTAALPLIAVGSGGSLTAAHVACILHQSHWTYPEPVDTWLSSILKG